MARKLYYGVRDDTHNVLDEDQWDEIIRLQNWYNGEFVWTAGKISLRRYIVFPKICQPTLTDEDVIKTIREKTSVLKKSGLPEHEIVDILLEENLIIIKRGGYREGCLASGYTRVGGNEFNAYLTCEFLLHASRIVKHLQIEVIDEGEFVKSKSVIFNDGSVFLRRNGDNTGDYLQSLLEKRRVFSIVDAAKYDHVPNYRMTIPDFSDLNEEERLEILRDWSWFGFHNTYDRNGDDIQGFDLNQKVKEFSITA
jgi:hypothetical protein